MVDKISLLTKETLASNPKDRPTAQTVANKLYRILGDEARRLSVKLELERPTNYEDLDYKYVSRLN